MAYSGLLCLFLTFWIPLCHTNSMETPSRYECGRHGKFEYCIDGIPGCVIGCHCHPGYYFDTETKICEPNLKLTDDFKRRFMFDPNRIYPINTPTLIQNVPTQTTTNTITDRIDEISKDTDDIGEWLYNQFFNTIENQVINKTNDDKPMTRRNMDDLFSVGNEPRRNAVKNKRGSRKNIEGGSDTRKNKKKSKTRKSSKGRGKKNKSKVHGLRRKLLRITEDDSLFDSDSGSESGEDASTSSSSSSSESGSSDDKVGKDDKDKDHGHKKVIIFNRRPRPPLPSFIFLPNMDTPYYPPIGLPPPPILPMYPMVPVPPMAPFLPFIEKEKNSDTTTIASKSEGTTDTASTSGSPSNEQTSTTTTTEQSPEPSETNIARIEKRTKSKSHKERKSPPELKSEELFLMRSRDPESSVPLTAKQMERIQLVNALKERLKMKKKLQNLEKNDENGSNENIDLFGDEFAMPEQMLKHQNRKGVDQKSKDVNFKYLSQLIHRAKQNKSEVPPLPSDLNKKNLENIPKTRRLYAEQIPIIEYDKENVTPRNSVIKDQSDEYFMNLGRQIASLIRDEDVKIQNKATKAPQIDNLQESINSILNENRYTPRSYWERYVRSPLSRLKSYLAGLHFYKEDNEMNLFSLEDEVNTFASTARPLSLQDLENLLTSLKKDNYKLNNSYIYPRQTEVSFNVNLLPKKELKLENVYRRMHEAPVHYIPRTIKTVTFTKEQRGAQISNDTKYLEPAKTKGSMSKVLNFIPTVTHTPSPSNQMIINILTKNKSLERNNSNYNSMQYFPLNYKINTKIPKVGQIEYFKFLKKNPVVINPNTNKSGLNKHPEVLAKFTELPAKYQKLPDKSKSTLMNYNKLNYFSDTPNRQHYLFQASYPLDVPPFKQSFSKRIETDKPSYFHHEFHHFDYFD